MKSLYKHNLTWEPTLEYVEDHIDEANALSIELMKSTNFEEGNFFVLLPPDANFENLYNFKEGEILPQNPIRKFPSGSTYQYIPTIEKELSELILKEIEQKKNLCCLLDDVLCYSYQIKNEDQLYNHRLIHNKELYYLFEKRNLSCDRIFQGLKASEAFWHSLGVLTTAKIKNIELNLEDFQNIVSETQLIIVGAYDGEAYVFWEKKPHVFWEDLKA